MSQLRKSKSDIPIRQWIMIVFMAAMVISICSMGYVVFTSWFSSAKQTTEEIAAHMNEEINHQINLYLQVPEQINESNHKIIQHEILDFSEERLRDRFFAGVLNSYQDKIYSFSFGSANGDYYGARRNETGMIELMRNNAATGGNSWYYSLNADYSAGELAAEAGQFDPRDRAWYKTAATTGGPVFSAIYKHFVMDDLAISYASPVYGEDGTLQGVLGTHMLLRDLGGYLEDAVSQFKGYALILEKGSEHLIANSMRIDNFSFLQDGSLNRHDVSRIQNTDLADAYDQYKLSSDPTFLHQGKDRNFYINVQEIQAAGLDWVVISSIPEDFLLAPAVRSMRWAVVFTAVSLTLSFMVYSVITGRLLRPIGSLLKATDDLSSGKLSTRLHINRNDEIGQISDSFNKVAAEMQFLVNNLEASVAERTDELQKAITTIEENKNQLRLILDSAAEAIYGIDRSGNCTFCNFSCIKMLGYSSESELLGKNMHWKIHHSRRDGSSLSAGECKILIGLKQGRGAQADDEVFWRADGTPFEVEYFSYPQERDGEIIGAVVTFMDISDRKQKEAEIKYLSYHDPLTGLLNRRCFEENRVAIDTPDNLPLSVIFADINGLKLTNDIFGHAAGDELIRKSSEILQKVCRENDLIARIGGDEFVILLPETSRDRALKILAAIKSGFADPNEEAIHRSISIGLDTKQSVEQLLDVTLSNAENAMYKDKTMNRKSVSKNMVDTIIRTLHTRNPREKQHSISVSALGAELGAAMNLPVTEKSKLKRAGYLHNIGKIILDEDLLRKDILSEEEAETVQQYSIVGYRILSLFDDTMDIAEYVYGCHERWDGSGYPQGMKGEQIPLLSRIIAVAENYVRICNRDEGSSEDRKPTALEAIEKGAGTQFDPRVAELFIQMMNQRED